MGLSTLLLDSPIFMSRPSLTPSVKILPCDKQTRGRIDEGANCIWEACSYLSFCPFVRFDLDYDKQTSPSS